MEDCESNLYVTLGDNHHNLEKLGRTYVLK